MLSPLVPARHAPEEPQPAPEDEVLLRDDDDEERGPVAEDGEEVREDGSEVLAPRDAGDGVGDEDEERPREARDAREGAAERLNGEPGGVGVWDVVCAAHVVKF